MKKWKLDLGKKSKPVEVYRKEAVEGIKAKVDRMQLSFLARPKLSSGEFLDPRLPVNLTGLNDVQLGKLYGEFCIMAQYAQLQLALKGVDRAVAKQAERMTRAEVQLVRTGTVADKAAKVEIDARVQERSLATLVGENVEVLTDAFLQVYIIGRDACSREMSRRQWVTKEHNPR